MQIFHPYVKFISWLEFQKNFLSNYFHLTKEATKMAFCLISWCHRKTSFRIFYQIFSRNLFSLFVFLVAVYIILALIEFHQTLEKEILQAPNQLHPCLVTLTGRCYSFPASRPPDVLKGNKMKQPTHWISRYI